jgi:hypothetical protein
MSYRQPAAKRGEGVCPRLNWRCADEFVKEPAVLAQLRIRRRHLAGNLFSSIENNLNPQRAQTQATARPLGPLASRPRTARKSALESRGCSHFCPTVAVDTAELHDKIRKAQKMHKFNKFGVFSPPSRRGGTRAEPTAAFLRSTRKRANPNGMQGDLRGLGADSYPFGRFWYAAIAPTLCSKPIFERQSARQLPVGSPV